MLVLELVQSVVGFKVMLLWSLFCGSLVQARGRVRRGECSCEDVSASFVCGAWCSAGCGNLLEGEGMVLGEWGVLRCCLLYGLVNVLRKSTLQWNLNRRTQNRGRDD